jgi:HPt (histidine-containing phosphotransfer) domain-containing protein
MKDMSHPNDQSDDQSDDQSKEIESALNMLSESLGPEPVLELIDLFTEHSQEQIGTILSSALSEDWATVQSETHSLKSSSASLGAKALSESCYVIEKSIAAGVVSDAAREKLGQIENQVRGAVEVMKTWKKRSTSSQD